MAGPGGTNVAAEGSESGPAVAVPAMGSVNAGARGKRPRKRRLACEIERKHPCTQCKKSYGSEGALKLHIRKKHRKGPTVRAPGRILLPTAHVHPRSLPQVIAGRMPLPRLRNYSKVARHWEPRGSSLPSHPELHMHRVGSLPGYEMALHPDAHATPSYVGHHVHLPQYFGEPMQETLQMASLVPISRLRIGSWQETTRRDTQIFLLIDSQERAVHFRVCFPQVQLRISLHFDHMEALAFEQVPDGLALAVRQGAVPEFSRLVPGSFPAEWSSVEDFTNCMASTFSVFVMETSVVALQESMMPVLLADSHFKHMPVLGTTHGVCLGAPRLANFIRNESFLAYERLCHNEFTGERPVFNYHRTSQQQQHILRQQAPAFPPSSSLEYGDTDQLPTIHQLMTHPPVTHAELPAHLSDPAAGASAGSNCPQESTPQDEPAHSDRSQFLLNEHGLYPTAPIQPEEISFDDHSAFGWPLDYTDTLQPDEASS